MGLFCTDILCEPDKRFRYFILFEIKWNQLPISQRDKIQTYKSQ